MVSDPTVHTNADGPHSVENLTPHPPHAPPQLEEAAHPMLPKDEAECETHAAAHGLSATLGLVIHGAADGIALGASSLSDNKGLGMIVFLAIIIHKGESHSDRDEVCSRRQTLTYRPCRPRPHYDVAHAPPHARPMPPSPALLLPVGPRWRPLDIRSRSSVWHRSGRHWQGQP